MVSALQSVRLLTSQYMLKAMKQVEQQQQQQSQGSTAQSALLSRYGIDTSSSSSSGSGSGILSTMLDALEATYDVASSSTDTTENPAISDDITTASFMKGLKAKLTDLKTQPGYADQAEAMLAALKAGTLTVSDPVNGRQIKAWDATSDAEKNTTSKPGTAIDNTGWSDFLKAHLTRGEGGTYARQADGSFVDKPTGQNAYFGTIGSDYVYLTWPASAVKS